MFNEEIKKRFISEKEKVLSVSTKYIKIRFDVAAEKEMELGKDLCNWSVYDILDYYKVLNLSSYDSLICLNSIFSQYTHFCINNGLVNDSQNHYDEINLQLLSTCLNKAMIEKKIVSKVEIYKWINELPNPSDQFVLLFLFEVGKSTDFLDIFYAKMTDIDVYNNTIKLKSGRTVKVSNKLINIARDCDIEKKYYPISGNANKIMPLLDLGYIIKHYPNTNLDTSDYQRGRGIYRRANRIFNFLGSPWLNPNAIVESGKLNMIVDKAKEYDMTPMEYLYSDNITEVENQYGVKILQKMYSRKYSEYLL